MFKKSLAAIVALLAAGSIAAFAGMFNGFPIIGGSSYCMTTINGVCSQTIPAGPTYLTGNETIPVDTNLSQGQNPQTALVTTGYLGGFNSSKQSGATITYTVGNTIRNVILTHTTTITSAAITAPANPINGQVVKIGSSHTVTTFSFVANTGQTLAVTTPTVLTASTTVPQGYEFIYYDTVWYRMQ